MRKITQRRNKTALNGRSRIAVPDNVGELIKLSVYKIR